MRKPMRRKTSSPQDVAALACTLFVNYWTNHPLSVIISPLEIPPEQDVRWIQLKIYSKS